MNFELTELKSRVELLRLVHLKALGAFNAFEQLQEFRAPNIHGQDLARKHANAIGEYRGFFNPAGNALNTELHLSVAKLFVSHRDALHIDKLIRYAESNQQKITKKQQESLQDPDIGNDLNYVYEGLSHSDLLEIRNDLSKVADKIARLKRIRDREVAHIDIKKNDDLYLTYEEFSELIELSEKILNLVSVRIYGDAALFDSYGVEVANGTRALLQLVADSAVDGKTRTLPAQSS